MSLFLFWSRDFRSFLIVSGPGLGQIRLLARLRHENLLHLVDFPAAGDLGLGFGVEGLGFRV